MATSGTETQITSYEEARASHEWRVPERYNIAADVCDKHPRDKLAMVWEDFRGDQRRVSWGELQSLSARAANVLRAHGVERGDRVAVVAPATPETAAVFFGTWKLGAILLSMSVLYGDEGIRHRISDSQAKLIVCSPDQAERDARRPGRGGGVARRESPGRRRRSGGHRRHRRRRPGAALLLVGHDRAREGHPPRPSLHPRPRGVHLLPRRPRRRALPRHGGVGMGGGHRATPRALAARRHAVRLRARGRLRPRKATRGAVEARGDEPVHDAHRDAGDDGDRRRRRALPPEVPNRLLGRRAAESRGDPLVSRAVRAHGARLLRADRVLPAVRELPVHGGSRGLDGQGGARLGRADPRRGRAARSPRASAARSACGRGRTRTTRSGTGTTRRPPRRPSAGSGSTPRTPPSRTRTATSGTRAEPTT